jgi:predicted transcriptional regulator
MIDALTQIGFSKNDALVYKALVDLGPCFVAPLVRQTKKHRQIVYNSLSTLGEKHLVTVTQKNGKHYYEISDPHRLLADIKQKEVITDALVKSIEEKQRHDHEQVEVFAGATSYEKGTADFRERAREAREYIVIRGETGGWFEHTRSFFKDHVEGLRSLKRGGIDVFITFFEYERVRAKEFIGPHINNPYSCKIIPDEYKLPHSVWLAGDHVYILTPAADPLVIHIKSKSLAKQYREYFWRIWSKGKILK